jgi:hypothetical protein
MGIIGQTLSSPAIAGEGDHPATRAARGGWWRGRGRCGDVSSFTLAPSSCEQEILQRQRSVDSEAPSTALRAVPLPRTRGRMSEGVLATHIAPEVCRPKPPSFCLQKNKGRRSAEKAQLSRGASPRARMLPSKRASGEAARPCAGRARLAALHRGSRRSHPRLTASGRVSWNRRVQTGGPSPAPVQRAPRGPARAGRAVPRSRPARIVSVRTRAPHPLPQPGAPS